LEISYDQTESVVGEDAIRVMREYAESGRYQIIWSTEGAGVDYIQTMNKEFPEIIFAHPGPEQGLGDNDAWVQNLVYEAAYLQGYMAGMMTETNIIGFIGSFPGAEANTEGNAYIAGATEANPDVKVKVTFINSWWDPALAKEAAIAQIAADCDLIFPKVYGAFEALEEKGLLGFGGYVDQSDLAPNVVLSSTLLRWDANLKYTIDEFWNATKEGRPYNIPQEAFYAQMKDGGAGIAYNEDLIPTDVLEKVKAKHEEILSGDFVVPLIWDEPSSN